MLVDISRNVINYSSKSSHFQASLSIDGGRRLLSLPFTLPICVLCQCSINAMGLNGENIIFRNSVFNCAGLSYKGQVLLEQHY